MKPSPSRRLLPLKPADFMVLAVLQEGPSHGYALSQAMAERSQGHVKVRPGDLYRVLYRLSDQELVEAAEPEQVGGRRRALYRLTELGGQVLKAEACRLVDLGMEVLERSQAGWTHSKEKEEQRSSAQLKPNKAAEVS